MKKLFNLAIVYLIMLFVLVQCGPGAVKKQSFDKSYFLSIKKSDLKGDPAATFTLHYFRPDGDYKTWGMWLWAAGKEGKVVAFDGVDKYGAYKNIYFKTKKVGFIVRKMDKWVKDIGKDRFWEASMAKDIFLRQGQDPVFTDVIGSAMKKLVSASIIADKKILCQLSVPAGGIEAKDVVLIDAQKNRVGIKAITEKGNSGLEIVTVSKLKINATYSLEIAKFTGKIAPRPDAALLSTKAFTYNGNDLGAVYSKSRTTFKVWAPIAEKVELSIYKAWDAKKALQVHQLQKGSKGVWQLVLRGDLKNTLYNYKVYHNGVGKSVVDPYGKGMAAFNNKSGANIGKSAVVDLTRTNPTRWSRDRHKKIADARDAVIYEIHVRDFTISPSSGVPEKLRGTYLGFIKKLDYLKDLGVTHVQLLPVQNFYYGNEMDRKFESANNGSAGFRGANYNWGYDPHNYFSPEGWFSLDPKDPEMRIRELKTLVKAIHDKGMGVILDVVYNHTATTSVFEPLVPGYYYRSEKNGSYCNGSGCGNEVASRRPMVRKLIIDSLAYWTKEYHVDGFRFDLLGLTDETTVKLAWNKLKKINPSIILHGEGWNVGSYLPVEEKYIKTKSQLKKGLGGMAVFNDGIRDAIKSGGLAGLTDPGFVAGNKNVKPYIKMSVVGSLVNYLKDDEIRNFKTQKSHIIDMQKNSQGPTARNYAQFTDSSADTLNYITCHDNRTLWDKIKISAKGEGLVRKDFERMARLANVILFTSQGRVFMHGGVEMLRSKPNKDRELGYDHNSYDSGDNVNQIDWTRIERYKVTHNFIKGLIKLRQSRRAFRMRSAKEIINNITFLNVEGADPLFVSYKIEDRREAKGWKNIVVLYNANRQPKEVKIPGLNNSYRVVLNEKEAGVKPVSKKYDLSQGRVTVEAYSAMILVK